MICSKCIYYAGLVGRSYDLSKCLKLQMFTNPGRFTKSSIEICKGEHFKINHLIRLNDLIKK